MPGQSLDESPSVTSEVLQESSFTQEQYITMPAAQLFHNPGIYQLQVSDWLGCQPAFKARFKTSSPGSTVVMLAVVLLCCDMQQWCSGMSVSACKLAAGH